jgi:hypothetical protein
VSSGASPYKSAFIDNVPSEGIDCKRLMKLTETGWKEVKIVEKERNEQADLVKKEENFIIVKCRKFEKTEFFQVRG